MVYEKMYESNDTPDALPSDTVAATPEAAPPTDPNTTQIQVNVDFLRKTRVHICMPCHHSRACSQNSAS